MFDLLVERLISDAAERGAFDDLPGQGKPLAILDEPYEESWWLRRFIEREQLHFLPEAQAITMAHVLGLDKILALKSETEVRRRVAALNHYIASRKGPRQGKTLEPEAVVRQWRAHRRRRRATRWQ